MTIDCLLDKESSPPTVYLEAPECLQRKGCEALMTRPVGRLLTLVRPLSDPCPSILVLSCLVLLLLNDIFPLGPNGRGIDSTEGQMQNAK